MYYNPMPVMRTPVRAWVETSKALLKAPDFHLGGVFVHVEQPNEVTNDEVAVIQHVDTFLRKHGQYPVSTVANTIFPESLDYGDGVLALSERYLEVHKRRMCSGWGRYFERFVMWPDHRAEQPINQLAQMIEMLSEARAGTFHTDKYELVISDPTRYFRSIQGRPCLSLVELKPEKPNVLHMSAIYRNHHYIRKTLGNMLGLASLQNFIARESGFKVGTLTLSSTSATLETVAKQWGKDALRTLIHTCDELLVRREAA